MTILVVLLAYFWHRLSLQGLYDVGTSSIADDERVFLPSAKDEKMGQFRVLSIILYETMARKRRKNRSLLL